MTGRSSPWPGFTLFVLGLGVAILGLSPLRPEWAPLPPLVVAGTLVALLGMALSLRALASAPPDAGFKPAHVAFFEKPRVKFAPPSRLLDRPSFAEVVAPGRPSLELRAIEKLDTEIREINRQIDRAKVMYGTGKLSGDGYVAYVKDLQSKRGELEARRVRLQFDDGTPRRA